MSPNEAREILNGIAHLKFFPSNPEAVASLVILLIEITKGDAHKARILVHELSETMDEYPGPASMRKVYFGLYPPPGSPTADFVPNRDDEPIADPESFQAIEAIKAEMERKFPGILNGKPHVREIRREVGGHVIIVRRPVEGLR